MNYNSVILVGVVALTTAWWLLHATRHYPGPKVMHMYIHEHKLEDSTAQDAVPVIRGTTPAETEPVLDEKK
jgi:choline transport protein